MQCAHYRGSEEVVRRFDYLLVLLACPNDYPGEQLASLGFIPDEACVKFQETREEL